MSNREDLYEKIDAFILGQLSAEESDAFTRASQEDADLQTEIELRRAMLEGIRIEGRKELAAKLNDIHNKKDRTPGKTAALRKLNLKPWYAAAAALALLVATWFMFQSPSNSQLADRFYEPYELSIGLRDNAGQEQLAQIDALYADGKYTQALPLLENYLDSAPSENNLRLALAICQFETKSKEAALQSLQLIEASNDPFLQDQVSWYRALIYLEDNQSEKALPLLQELATDNSADHHAAAKELLQRLK